MSVSDLIERFRSETDDIESPGYGDDSESLWKDTEILTYMDVAQKAFARDTRLLRDSSTASITQLSFTIGNKWVTVSPKIIKPHRARLTDTARQVVFKEFHEMDAGVLTDDFGFQFASQWETQTGAEPKILVTDMENGKYRVVPIPTVAGTIDLTVDRLPLTDITSVTSTLEITEFEHLEVMLYYMMHLAYLKNDADTYDPSLSASMLAHYNNKMAPLKRDVSNVRTRAGTVRYGGL